VNYIKEYVLKTKIIGQIHDSIIADVPIYELEDFLEIAADVMVTKLRKAMPWLIVPMDVEATIGELNWFDKYEVKI
jgi:DNA polymerase I-like protein with 3'-5' exonuclease and polymerase domains